MRILGIDPGLRHTGWGIIDVVHNSYTAIAHGTISVPDKGGLAHRLNRLFQEITSVIETHQPHEAAVEETFVNTNPRSTLKLGMARGVLLLAPAHKNIPVSEYAANQVKKSVVGAGHADKEQMMRVINMLLPTLNITSADAADALAVAITHANMRPPQGVYL